MIAPNCAWVRVGLRRIPNTPSRNNSGNTSNLERARLHLRLHPSNASRRYNGTNQNGGQGTQEAARTIPGPSWLWLDPIVEPFRAYGRVQQRRPYMTQLVSSLIIYFIGDCVAQSITQPDASAEKQQSAEEDEEKGWVQQWSDDRDWTRTARALAIGGISAIPSYKWFLWLSNSFNYSSKTLSLSIKVFINQTLFTPLFNSYFFGMQTLLAGATFPEIIERISNTVPTSWYNSWKVWPAVTAFSFSYVPIQYRSIFGGVVAIGWQTYLNLLNQAAAAEEELEHAAEQAVAPSVRTVHTRTERGQAMQKCAA